MPDADTPRRTPRRDNRQQWTLKHRDLTPELRALVAKAAEMQGMPVGQWVAEMQGMPVGQWVAHVLRERGQAVVTGKPVAGCLSYPRSSESTIWNGG
jgi:hypothetical protein